MEVVLVAYRLAIHGGAGVAAGLPEEVQQEYHASLRQVLRAGQAALASGASAVETVALCVTMLEDNALFNAGRGSCLNRDGKVEMDASIMDGATMRAGAVANIGTVRNPVRLAQALMEQSPPVLVAGPGAEALAREFGLALEPMEHFVTSRRRQQWQDAQRTGQVSMDHEALESELFPEPETDTVGAVAMDQEGNLAAATSTGGMSNKQPGRVGDSPLVGCGVWAENATCAVSCTGVGEDFIRTALARTTACLIAYKGLDGPAACAEALDYLVQSVNGMGGMILVDHEGRIAADFVSDGMFHGWTEDDGEPCTRIYKASHP